MKLIRLFAAFALVVPVYADVRLPHILSDGMVLQRQVPVRIWGSADPGEKVSVAFRAQNVATTAGANGKWEAFLQPLEAGGPDTLTVTGKNSIALKDVLVGEVWVGSGQSNMGWTVANSNNPEKEIASANYAKIRLFKVPQKLAAYPQSDVQASWSPCTPESVKNFSAVAYFFGRHLHEKLNVPVGIIQSAWGGTPAEAWTSMTALTADPALTPALANWANALRNYEAANERYEVALKNHDAAVAKAKAEGRTPPPRPQAPRGPGHPHEPASLYNGMIAPLTPFAIRGAIWYQGESNANVSQVHFYNRLFETMIRDWRRAWANPDFPFLFVQLANFTAGPNNKWPELREAQTQTLALRNTGMAVTIDIGEPKDIHPRNKQDVGTRLGLAARAIAYGEKIEYSGPMASYSHRDGANAVRVWFDHAAGLTARGGAVKGFELAGADGRFVPAEAAIEGQAIVVKAEEVEAPVAVRYGWADSPECNVYNSAGLPASPFRAQVRE